MKPVWTLMLCVIAAVAQTQQRSSGEPIDFMTIVIEGRESLYLPKSLIKQSPAPPQPYHVPELDSINTLEKVPLYRSTPPSYPTTIALGNQQRATIEVRAGLYGFATAEGLYRTRLDQWTIDFDGMLDRGGAYVANAEYFRGRFHARAQTATASDSTTPRATTAELLADARSYRLFADPLAPSRSFRQLSATVYHDGKLGRLPLRGQLLISNNHLTHADSINSDESGIRAAASITPLQERAWQLGVGIDVSYRSYRNAPLHFHTLALNVGTGDSTLSITANVGGQLARTSWGTTEFAPLLEVSAERRISSPLYLRAQLRSGMEPVSFGAMLQRCPYLVDSALIGIRRSLYDLSVGASYMPTTTIAIDALLQLRALDTAPYVDSASLGTFALRYAAQSERLLQLRGRMQFDSGHHVAAIVTLRDARLDGGARVPYVPFFESSLEYGRRFGDALIGTVHLGYVSPRRISTRSSSQLAGYLVLAGRAEYRITSSIALTLTFDNLFGSTIELWHRYRERGTFVALGIMVQL